MAKKFMKRSAALGALMTMLICGQAWAAESTTPELSSEIISSTTKVNNVIVTSSKMYYVGADNQYYFDIYSDSGNTANTVSLTGSKVTLNTPENSAYFYGIIAYGGNVTLGSKENESIVTINATANSYNYAVCNLGGNININGKEFNVKSNKWGLYNKKSDSKLAVDTDSVDIETNYVGIGTYNSANTSIKANDIKISSANWGIENNSSGKLTLDASESGEITISSGRNALAALNGSEINVTTKELNIETANDVNGIYNYGGNISVKASDVDIKSGYGATAYNAGTTTINANNIDIATDARGIDAGGEGTVTLNADTINITNDADSDGKGGIGISAITGNVVIKADTLNVESKGNESFGIHVQNNTQVAEGEEGYPENPASVNIAANTINVKSDYIGISAFSNGQMNINGDLTVNAEHVIDVRGNSTTKINTEGNGTTVLNGDIVFETPNVQGGDSHSSGNIIAANVEVNLQGEGSEWNGQSYVLYSGVSDNVNSDAGDYYGNVESFKLSVVDGAKWNATGSSFVNDITLNKGTLNIADAVDKINVDTMTANNATINFEEANAKLRGASGTTALNINKFSGSDNTIVLSSESNEVNVGTNAAKATSVTATQAYSEKLVNDTNGNMEAAVQRLAKQVAISSDLNEDAGESIADKVSIKQTTVAGAVTASLDDNGDIASIVEAENTDNRALSDLASLGLMTWRAENNDMNKRLGELRDSKNEHGVWARMARGESKYGAQSVKNQYNYYQVGYDEKLSSNENWTVGIGVNRTEGNSSFSSGTGENKHTGVAVYGSYLADNGSFVDLIAKYSRIDNEFKSPNGIGNGDYKTNGYSVSAEYGKRFTKDNGFYIEPQVELTYGKVGSASYATTNAIRVHQDGMDSLVGRLGFALGKKFNDKGNAYVRASYLYDFDADTSVTYSNSNGVTRTLEQDLGGGWWEVGVGTNVNLSESTHLYFDVEKTYGGDIATPWQWNVGVRYSF
jgi:outer membrane autotransporter protein